MRRRIGLGVVAALLLVGLLLWRHEVRRPSETAGAPASASSSPSRSRPDFAPAGRAASALVAPRAAISGRVAEPGGKAVPGAQVCAQGSGLDLSENELRDPSCTLAGPDGRYRLGNLYAAVWQVNASANGHLPGQYREAKRERLDLGAGQERTGVDLILRPGGAEVRGRVRDIGGGVVAGAIVSIGPSMSWWDASLAVARTDEKGEWQAWVAPGRVRANAQAAGYAPGSREGMAPGSFIEILVTPEAVLVGRVVEVRSGAPVAGAVVNAGPVAMSEGYSPTGDGDTSALSDAEGRFRIERLQPGRYKPVARTADRYGRARESVLLGLGERSGEALVAVHPAVTLTGKVLVTGTEEPCHAGWVSLSDKQAQERASELVRHDGTVELRGLMPGSYQVNVTCSDYLSEDRYPNLVVTDKPLAAQTWHVRPGLHIAGIVVDSDGTPVRGGTVIANLSGGDPRAQRVDSWESLHPDGTFQVTGLMPGTYLLRVSATAQPEPKEAEKVTVAAGRSVDGLRIVLDRWGAVKGTVADEEGHPVPDVEVQATGEAWSWAEPQLSHEDGSFLIEGLRPGSYRIVASRRGAWGEGLRAPGSADDDVQGTKVAVKAGAVATVKLVVERQSGKISGTVSHRGKPVTDAFVDAQRESESAAAAEGEARRSMRWAWDRQPVLTDADGRFTLGSLSPGKYLVRAYRKGGGEASAEHVAVGTSVALVIKPTGSLSGTVVLAGKPPPDQFGLTLVDEEQGIDLKESFWRTGGAWVLRELPAGHFKVNAITGAGDAHESVTLAEGQSKDGLRLEVKPRATVRGQLVALDGGKPVPGLRVMAQLPSSSNQLSYEMDPGGERKNISDAEGRFQLDDVPLGRILVFAFPMDMEAAEYSFCLGRATVQPGQELALPPIRCARRRLKSAREVGGDVGFTLKQVSPTATADPIPLVVAVVRPGGPAAAAGLHVKDIITSIDGQDVTGFNDYLYWTLSQVPQGTTLALGLARGGTLSLTAGPPP